MAAGVARLALQKYPSWTASHLRQKMRDHARYLGYSVPSDLVGYGMVDALCLLHQKSTCNPIGVSIQGSQELEVYAEGNYIFEAQPSGGSGMYAYVWEYCPVGGGCQVVGNSQQYVRYVGSGDPDFMLKVTVTSSDEVPAVATIAVANRIEDGQ